MCDGKISNVSPFFLRKQFRGKASLTLVSHSSESLTVTSFRNNTGMKETTVIQQERITALLKIQTISHAYSYPYYIEYFRWRHSKNVPFTIKSMKSKSMGMCSEIPEESIQIVLSTTCNVVQGWDQPCYFVQKLGDYFLKASNACICDC